MDNLGKNWQLINILFCSYQRRSEIRHLTSDIHQKCVPKPVLAWAQMPQQVIISVKLTAKFNTLV